LGTDDDWCHTRRCVHLRGLLRCRNLRRRWKPERVAECIGYARNLGSNSNAPSDIQTTLATALGVGWSRLDKTDDAVVYDALWPDPLTLVPSEGANTGTWRLASGLWGSFDRLVLVLKDGSFDPNGTNAAPVAIRWIWYEITAGDYGGDWFLGTVINCQGDGSCAKNLSHGELFG
jgi:hypothetical protein